MTELTTGWEPDAPVDDSFARRFLFSYADRTAAMAARTGGRVEEVDGARMVDLASPFGYDNVVLLTRPPGPDLAAVVDRARGFFPPERWWVVLSLFATPDLSAVGLVPVGHPPVMLRPAAPPPESRSGLDVRRVGSRADLDDFEAVLVAGYGLERIGTPSIADLALAGSLLDLVVGYRDGEPVACAGGAARHGITEVDWVAVHPDHRGHGDGSAITAAVLSPDRPAMLISSDDGHGVYRRLGFLDLFRATMWECPPR